jgi:hypothetical protein
MGSLRVPVREIYVFGFGDILFMKVLWEQNTISIVIRGPGVYDIWDAARESIL